MTSATPVASLNDLANWLKLLADPNRLRIIDLLMQGTRCNCELGEALGMAPNLISHHLGVLRRAGLIDAQRDAVDARWIYYSMNQAALGEVRLALDRLLNSARTQIRRPECSDARSS